MLSLYEILKASKTGIAPDMWTALAGMNWGGADSGHEIKELTGIPPLSFTADGTPLLDYTIYGNMSQTGTPTPDSPIQPQETGERTGNLWSGGNVSIAVGDRYKNTLIDLPTNTYTFKAKYSSTNTGSVTIGFYDENNTIHTYNMTQIDGEVSASYTGIITAIRLYSAAEYTPSASYSAAFTDIMLNTGSPPLPYEPYGYKIPVETSEDILVNNLTSKEVNGLTVTRNADGSVSVKGTSTANTNLCIYNDSLSATAAAYQIIENGQYLIGGGIAGGAENEFILSASYDDALGGTPARRMRVPYGEEIPLDNSDGAYRYLCVYIAVWRGATVDFTCKPYLKAVSATNNIYLGEVPTTRKIKKLVLDGTENWKKSGAYAGSFYLEGGAADAINTGYEAFCSHVLFTTISSYAQNKFCFNGSPINLNLWLSQFGASTTVDDFKTYLAQQYAAGTPVTVWYVLAEPTTGIVNEPLRKIGDYADTLSMEQTGVQIPTNRGNTVVDVDTTLKPSEMYIKYQE